MKLKIKSEPGSWNPKDLKVKLNGQDIGQRIVSLRLEISGEKANRCYIELIPEELDVDIEVIEGNHDGGIEE